MPATNTSLNINTAENTKIELITEAFEQLAVAVAQGMIHAGANRTSNPSADVIAAQIKDAREEVSSALRALLKPTLRVVG
jgi:hypothetical protein